MQHVSILVAWNAKNRSRNIALQKFESNRINTDSPLPPLFITPSSENSMHF